MSPRRLRRAAERHTERGGGSPLRLIDPALVGTQLEDLLRRPLAETSSHEPAAPFGSFEVDAAREHRILPLIADHWLRPELRDGFRAERRHIAVVQLRIESELRSVAGVLAQEGIDFRVLKGLATAALDYPSRSMRQTGDVDLLVRPERLNDATRVLLDRGCRPHRLANGVDPLLLKGTTLVAPSGVEIDLHVRLNRYSRAAGDALWQRPSRIDEHLLALPDDMRLAHAAGHLMWTPFGRRRLSSLIDIGALRDRGASRHDALSQAEHIGMKGLVGVGMEIEARLRCRPHERVDWPRRSGLESRAFLSSRRALALEHLLALRSLPGHAARGRYVAQFANPSNEHLALRGGRVKHFSRLLPGRWG